jgi:hypothetical protein
MTAGIDAKPSGFQILQSADDEKPVPRELCLGAFYLSIQE